MQNKIVILIVFILIIILVLGGLYLYLRKPKEFRSQEERLPIVSPLLVLSPEGQKQQTELDVLRQTVQQNPLTKEEIKKQGEELDDLRQQAAVSSNNKSASSQASELDKFHSQ